MYLPFPPTLLLSLPTPFLTYFEKMMPLKLHFLQHNIKEFSTNKESKVLIFQIKYVKKEKIINFSRHSLTQIKGFRWITYN